MNSDCPLPIWVFSHRALDDTKIIMSGDYLSPDEVIDALSNFLTAAFDEKIKLERVEDDSDTMS